MGVDWVGRDLGWKVIDSHRASPGSKPKSALHGTWGVLSWVLGTFHAAESDCGSK